MSRKRIKNKDIIKYRVVPNPASVCEICLRNAGHGYYYYTVEAAIAHSGCTCAIIPGIEGQDEIEDLPSKYFHDRWEAVKTIQKTLSSPEVESLLIENGVDTDSVISAVLGIIENQEQWESISVVKRAIFALSDDDVNFSIEKLISDNEKEVVRHELNTWFYKRLIDKNYALFPCGDNVYCVKIADFDNYECLWKAPINETH